MALKILEKLEKRLKPSVYTNLHSNLTRLLNHELTTVRYSKSTTYTTNQLYTIDIRLRISIEKSVSTHIYLHLNKDNNCMEVQLVVGFHIPLPLSVPESWWSTLKFFSNPLYFSCLAKALFLKVEISFGSKVLLVLTQSGSPP